VEVDGVGDAEAEWKPDLAGVAVELEALSSDPFPVGCAVALDLVLCVFADADDGVASTRSTPTVSVVCADREGCKSAVRRTSLPGAATGAVLASTA
jgi:hypothetical protein